MEAIKFRVIKVSDNMCRIEAQDCRQIYRNIADGACICTLEIMLMEIEYITKEVENFGGNAVFIFD